MKFLKISLILIIFCLWPTLSANAIKIGLYIETEESVSVGVSKGGVIADAESGNYIMLLNPMKPYKLKDKGEYMVISVDDSHYRINNRKIIIHSTRENGLVYTKNKWYRGQLLVLNTKKGLTVINEVELENYIKGVVPAEMPPAWNTEAHKAQAIAARSYALASQGKRKGYGFDLKDTPEDQAYYGASAETPKTNQAVDATKGQVLIYDKKVIPAYYHASSGGWTLSAKQVWGEDRPYTVPVKSFDEKVPKNGHRVGMSQTGANVLANRGYSAYQILGYFYKNVMLRKLY